jgi:Protein of unknown function (DUF3299)
VSQTVEPDLAIDSAASDAEPPGVDYMRYRAVSSLAVVGLALGVLSGAAFFDWVFALVPACGMLVSALAYRRVRANASELTGQWLALAGLGLSVVFWIAGWTTLGVIYLTEVPPGYERINYAMLQPPRDDPTQLIPPEAAALDGRKVFIKGYVYPGAQQAGIQKFILVRDSGSCCFGGNPKLTDMIHVTLQGKLRFNYTQRMQRLGGTFHIQPGSADSLTTVYSLKADYLR